METSRWWEIIVAALMTALILMVEHWGPWQRLLGRKTHHTVNYIQGVLAIVVPITAVLVIWQMWAAVTLLWVVVGVSGLAVLGAYALDEYLNRRDEARVLAREGAALRTEIEHDPRPPVE